MKIPKHKLYSLLEPLPIPIKLWKDVALDFIIGLPLLKHNGIVYDVILVIVDRYSKMALYFPSKIETNAPSLATIMINGVFAKFGILTTIVSDRGTTFTSKY